MSHDARARIERRPVRLDICGFTCGLFPEVQPWAPLLDVLEMDERMPSTRGVCDVAHVEAHNVSVERERSIEIVRVHRKMMDTGKPVRHRATSSPKMWWLTLSATRAEGGGPGALPDRCVDTDPVDLAVRMIEAEDEPRIAVIEAAADQLLVEMFGPELFTDVTSGKDRVADPGFVLVAGRPCVGFAHVLEERGTAHLQQLAVDPAHGRRGLGAALVEACCEQARLRGYSQLSLTIFRDVPYNAPWYSRLGFVTIDEPDGIVARHVQMEEPYGRLAPRVVMSRPLGTPSASRSADITGDR